MEEYVKDARIPCKYGKKCYQQNTAHHQKYKHPPKRQKSPTNIVASKKRKLEDDLDKQAEPTVLQVPEKERCLEEEVEKENIKSETKDGQSTTFEEPHNSVQQQDNTTVDFDAKKFIKEKFLTEMPEDFYLFWEFCKEQNPQSPSASFKDVGLLLVGPYDVLANKFCNIRQKDPDEYLLHWRYYYDLPEIQTVLKGSDHTGYHIGYFRDTPDELPAFLASNFAEKDGVFELMGDNIFAAVSNHLENYKKLDPFQKMKASKLQILVSNKAKELGLSLSVKSPKILQREKKVLTKTFNKLGLVVPYNKRTQLGYRPLCVSNKELQTLLTKLKNASQETQPKLLADLQHVITATSIALDECDFGTGLELGWNIFFSGIDSLSSTTLRFLTDSYRLLGRDVFAKIAEVHLNKRSKGCNLSIL